MPAVPDPLPLFDAALRGTLLALLLLLAGVLLRDRPRLPAARVGTALLLGLGVQVVSAMPAFEASVPMRWQTPLVGISVANAVLFWIFVQALFDDEFRLRPQHLLAWAGAAALGAFNCGIEPGSGSVLTPVLRGLQRAVPLACAVLAAWAAARHWRADLVEGRRRLRVFIAGTGIVYTLVMLAARIGAPGGRLSETTATLDVLALLVMLGPVAWQMLRLGGSELFPLQLAPAATPEPEEPAPLPPPDAAEQRLAAALQRLMRDDRAYLEEDLTLAALAGKLGAPEYRLRRLINQRLGHRNFNAFVNGYRLEAARAALADPARRELPVLSIALDAGFQSIGPFNRAFKATTGLTPTEFRRQKLADI